MYFLISQLIRTHSQIRFVFFCVVHVLVNHNNAALMMLGSFSLGSYCQIYRHCQAGAIVIITMVTHNYLVIMAECLSNVTLEDKV